MLDLPAGAPLGGGGAFKRQSLAGRIEATGACFLYIYFCTSEYVLECVLCGVPLEANRGIRPAGASVTAVNQQTWALRTRSRSQEEH